MTPWRLPDVPEVRLSHEVPSEEVRMVPEEPTLTNNPVELVEPSSLLLQEMKVKLKRNTEKMISMCFTWFHINGLGKPKLYHDSGVFYKEVGRLWRFLTVKN